MNKKLKRHVRGRKVRARKKFEGKKFRKEKLRVVDMLEREFREWHADILEKKRLVRERNKS